jgi:ribosomal protein S18 acetylase RimI-like enzyme
MVADANDPSLKLYQRLGFRQIDEAVMYIELEWRAAGGTRDDIIHARHV